MDLIDYNQEKFEEICKITGDFASKLDLKDIRFVPISALKGDNVVDRSKNMDWYDGPTLMYLLENIHIGSDVNHLDARFPVQYVVRPQSDEFHDYRGYAGRIVSGIFRKGDNIRILPSGFTSKIKSIDTLGESLDMAFAPQSVTITLEDEFDISRGDMITKENNGTLQGQDIELMVCWLNEKPIIMRGKYAVKHTSKDVRCMVTDVKYKVDINTLGRNTEDKNVGLNDIARITIRTTKPLFYDSYRKNRSTGSLILIDEATNETVGAAMII